MAEPSERRDQLLQDSARRARVRERFVVPANAILAYSQVLYDASLRDGLEQGREDLGRIVDCAREVTALLVDTEAALADESQLRDLHHDLRTPLSTIKGYAELLLEEGNAPALELERLIRRVREIEAAIEGLGSTDPEHSTGPDDGANELAAALAATADRLEPLAALPTTPGHLLVIDDHENNRLLLQDILTLAGHTVETAASGTAGLALLDQQPVDLVLLDLLMPKLNGLEVLMAIRARPELADLPVVVLSGVDNSDMMGQCLAAGAQDFIRKPFDATILRARIMATLERKRLRNREQVYLGRLRTEKQRAEALLESILPKAVVARLGQGERRIADRIEDTTVLFADIVGFTTIAAALPAALLVADLDRIVSRFDELAAELGVEKIKTVGDAYLAVAGVPEAHPAHADAAAELALRMTEAVHALAPDLNAAYELRVGLHSGPVLAGVIGRRKFSYDVWGDTVNIASRLQTQSAPGHITLSDATRTLLRGPYRTEPLGAVDLRGRGRFATHRLRRTET
ncbi:MAG: adenylate/guanylate cyclase domain-containing protein [Geminicoccaceae bacterium]